MHCQSGDERCLKASIAVGTTRTQKRCILQMFPGNVITFGTAASSVLNLETSPTTGCVSLAGEVLIACCGTRDGKLHLCLRLFDRGGRRQTFIPAGVLQRELCLYKRRLDCSCTGHSWALIPQKHATERCMTARALSDTASRLYRDWVNRHLPKETERMGGV